MQVIKGFEAAVAAVNHDLLNNPDCTCDRSFSARPAKECGEQLPPDQYYDSCNVIASRITYLRPDGVESHVAVDQVESHRPEVQL